ncbi:MAG: ribonuclease P protein component [Chitinophagaceae bacterium]|nr:ribonuclease P protein component [Chitinophagaceae bacterium]
MSGQFTLHKKERLKSRKALEQLFSSGKSFVIAPYRVIYQPAETGLLFTVGVSARNFKKAVDRNRIKRQTREAYRLQKLPLKEWLTAQGTGLHLFLTYTAREKKDFSLLQDAVQKIILKLIKTLHESNPPAA